MQKHWSQINGCIKQQRGFTLIEILVAISILCVGLLAVASMQITSIRGNSFAEGTTDAITWACDRVEKLVQLGLEDFDNAQLRDTDGDGDTGLNDATSATADNSVTQGIYTIYWNVSEDSLLDNTKTINVIVTWTDHGVQKSVSLQTIIPEVL